MVCGRKVFGEMIQNDKREQRSIPQKCGCEAALCEGRVALGTPLSAGDCADQILFTSGSGIAQSRASSGSSGKGKQLRVFLHGIPITKATLKLPTNHRYI